MKFVLKQYDTELLSFDLRSEGVDGFVCKILKKSEKQRRLFPLGLNLTDKGLLDWLRSSVIPRNREFADKILSVYGLDHNNILGIVKLCMGLSVNDSYWIVPEGFEGKFKDYNLFENDFDKALSLIAWTGFGSVRPGGTLFRNRTFPFRFRQGKPARLSGNMLILEESAARRSSKTLPARANLRTASCICPRAAECRSC